MRQSKTRDASKVTSREAGAMALQQANLPAAMINGATKVGMAAVDQLPLGVTYPNVQSAIDDIVNLYALPINSVMTFADDATTPNGVSMKEELTITGYANDTMIEVYGVPVAVLNGDNASAIANKIVIELNKYKDKQIAFKNVNLKSGANNIVEVEFLDTNPHENYNYSTISLTITGLTTTPAKPGYGTWTNIGTSTIKNSSGGDITLQHYKRIA